MRFLATSIALLASSTLCISSAQIPRAAGTVKGNPVDLAAKMQANAARKAGASTTPGGGSQFLVGPEDDCNTPAVIAGQGNFAYDATGASTGTDGQICSGAINDDIWFLWTADVTGTATLTTCNNTTADTEMAAYDGSVCPGANAALACNDDACGLQSSIDIPVAAGTAYMIQVGTFSAGAGTVGSIDISITLASNPDDCNTAPAIVGQGNFAFDNSAATQGTEGQVCQSMQDDVWFSWTADITGDAMISTCNNTTIDSKLTGYPGSGCPADGTALACNDDACGLQSTIGFPVTSGSQYMIQVGAFSAGGGGLGSIDIAIAPPPGGSDNCATPDPIAGQGNFTYNGTGATTGTEGQVCSGSINDDVWFVWTADMTGVATASLCGNTSSDTEMAAYPGSTCPTDGSALACNDDACGVQSSISFAVTSGTQYMIQVGTFSAGAGGPGSMDLSIAVPPPSSSCYTLDEGSADNNVGIGADGDVLGLNAYGANMGADTITSLSATFGSTVFPGFYAGGPIVWGIWDDPTNDNDPSDAVLLWSMPDVADVGSIDTDVFQSVVVPGVPVTGTFFVGVVTTALSSEFPSALEQSVPSLGRGWVAASVGGPLDMTNLLNNALAPAENASLGLDGVWMMRAEGPSCNPAGAPGQPYCFGDGTGTPCPCGNSGALGEGCANSTGAGGLLVASGMASISNDTFQLDISGLPGIVPGLILRGANQTNGGLGILFGDGLLCTGGQTGRSQLQFSSAGAVTYTDFQPGVSFGAASFGAGLPTNYVFWYRDTANQCTGFDFNFTNAWTVTWQQ